jgi:two-component system, NtrC family, sensor histidine kinase HydH
MSRRMLVKVTAPTVAIGVLLLAACAVSAWYISAMQSNMTSILEDNVTSLRAAEKLESHLRQMRFDCFLYLLAPSSGLERDIRKDETRFEHWLEVARQSAHTPTEVRYIREIRAGYERYRRDFRRLSDVIASRKGPRDPQELARLSPLQHIAEPCRKYLEENEQLMRATAAESKHLSARLYLAMLVLGIGGPLGGLLSGFGIARGLSRSIHRLSVHVQDMSQHLDQDVGSVSLAAGGDLHQLDEQLRHVVHRVEEAAVRLQRQQRELLRAQQLSAVGQLAACVAHEIRNPLTSVKMLVAVGLRGRNPRPLMPEDLRVIHEEVVRLEQTVQNLLDFARLPSPKRSACDLREVIAQAADLVGARARQQEVEVLTRCPPQPVVAEVDRGQLCTVLVNLFLNALDAMPHGGRLEADLEAAPAGQVCLRVSDIGPGISPKVMADLFTPFASSKPTGTGLGLSISRRIIEEHGGALSAANRAEGGACFAINLPLGQEENSHAEPAGRR